MHPQPEEPPASFPLPPLPAAVHEWFAYVADLEEDSELIYDGMILDGLGVVDEASARRALAGYRFTYEHDEWVDEAETGRWDPSWIVLDSIGADPLIAAVSTPAVAVFEDEHGNGRWQPRLAHSSIREFIDAIERNDDVPGPPSLDLSFDWSVWAIDLGPDPMKTLLGLGKWPLFTEFTRSELLALRTALPARVAEGLHENGAVSCVEYGARYGATFEARTYDRGRAGAFTAADLEGLWGELARDGYTEPAPSDQLIASIETEIGFRLPDSYIELSRHRNGGPLARGGFPMSEPTGWADDHIAVTGIYAIGRTSRYSLAGELGATFMQEEWGYPAWGIGIADTPTAGHEQIMLDYRESGPDGEPRVVYVDQEADYRVTPVAPDFAAFIRGLVDTDQFDTE